MLDGLAARLAAYRHSPEEQIKLEVIHKAFSGAVSKKRMDDVVMANIAFHDAIYEAARNRRLVAMGQELSEFVRRFSTAAYASAGARARDRPRARRDPQGLGKSGPGRRRDRRRATICASRTSTP